jgi:hypothetical protein
MSWSAKIKELEKQGRVKKSKRIGRPELDTPYYKFVLFGIEFDWNHVLGLLGRSVHHYGKWKKKQEDLICAQLIGMPKIDFKAKYVYNWHEANRKKDPGNIAGAEKMIGDALQKSGIIPNDGWNEISGIEHRFYVDKTNPRLELEIIGI